MLSRGPGKSPTRPRLRSRRCRSSDPQSPITATLQGQDVCAAGGVTRSPVTAGAVPTVAGYQALLAGFHSSSLKALLAFAAAHR